MIQMLGDVLMPHNDCLPQLAGYLGWEVEVTSVDEPVIDRSLDSTRFRERTGWTPPSWDEMLSELAEEWQTAEGLYDGS